MPEFLECRNGKVWPNDRPGLGVSVDEKQLTFVEAMTEAAPGITHRRPDGSLTHWYSRPGLSGAARRQPRIVDAGERACHQCRRRACTEKLALPALLFLRSEIRSFYKAVTTANDSLERRVEHPECPACERTAEPMPALSHRTRRRHLQLTSASALSVMRPQEPARNLQTPAVASTCPLVFRTVARACAGRDPNRTSQIANLHRRIRAMDHDARILGASTSSSLRASNPSNPSGRLSETVVPLTATPAEKASGWGHFQHLHTDVERCAGESLWVAVPGRSSAVGTVNTSFGDVTLATNYGESNGADRFRSTR